MTTTFSHWTEPLKLKRGLFNGYRVLLAREVRGTARHTLARKLGMTAKELENREKDWCFWSEQEQLLIAGTLDFPVAFFVQDDPPALGSVFIGGHDEEGNHWCEHVEGKR